MYTARSALDFDLTPPKLASSNIRDRNGSPPQLQLRQTTPSEWESSPVHRHSESPDPENAEPYQRGSQVSSHAEIGISAPLNQSLIPSAQPYPRDPSMTAPESSKSSTFLPTTPAMPPSIPVSSSRRSPSVEAPTPGQRPKRRYEPQPQPETVSPGIVLVPNSDTSGTASNHNSQMSQIKMNSQVDGSQTRQSQTQSQRVTSASAPDRERPGSASSSDEDEPDDEMEGLTVASTSVKERTHDEAVPGNDEEGYVDLMLTQSQTDSSQDSVDLALHPHNGEAPLPLPPPDASRDLLPAKATKSSKPNGVTNILSQETGNNGNDDRPSPIVDLRRATIFPRTTLSSTIDSALALLPRPKSLFPTGKIKPSPGQHEPDAWLRPSFQKPGFSAKEKGKGRAEPQLVIKAEPQEEEENTQDVENDRMAHLAMMKQRNDTERSDAPSPSPGVLVGIEEVPITPRPNDKKRSRDETDTDSDRQRNGNGDERFGNQKKIRTVDLAAPQAAVHTTNPKLKPKPLAYSASAPTSLGHDRPTMLKDRRIASSASASASHISASPAGPKPILRPSRLDMLERGDPSDLGILTWKEVDAILLDNGRLMYGRNPKH